LNYIFKINHGKQQFFGKKKMEERIKKGNEDMNVNIHSDCILQIDIFYNKKK
jgi:purine-nucleoside phosphorylase